MRVFDLEAGERASIEMERVGLSQRGRCVLVSRTVRITATATDTVRRVGGALRRKFVDPEPELVKGADEVWVSDGPLF